MKNLRKYLFVVLTMLFTLGLSVQSQAYTGWKTVNSDGDMQYYDSAGKIVKNKWVGKRHLNSNGFMDRNKWLTKKINGKNTKVFVANDGNYIKNFKGGWVKIGSKYYYYTKSGTMYRSKWFKVGSKRYYVNKKGQRVTGLATIGGCYYYFTSAGVNKTGWQTIKNKKYYFMSTTRRAIVNKVYKFSNGKYYYFNKKGVMQTGWQKINGKYYYFKDNMKTGWLTIGSKTYYLSKATNSKGVRAAGIFSIAGKLYYFDPDTGVMAKNTTITYNDRKYTINANGVCSLVPDTTAPSADMLFFLTFESGSAAYNQTGGDNGCACGAYQFDYRYSLLNFVKYAYGQNPSVCKEFKTYAAYANTAANRNKLKSNKAFYTAWNKIYSRNKKTFSALQDTFARINYYDPTESELFRSGIDISGRPDVVKGAVYSYSIQHGQSSAVAAVKAIKVTSTMTNKTFLKKLYDYRIKKFPAYKTRYTQEYQQALKRL